MRIYKNRFAGLRFESQLSSLKFQILLVALLLAGSIQASAQTPTIDSEEQLMVQLINDYRAQNGLGKLSISIALTRSADWMSTDMSTKNYFGHTDSQGRSPFDRMKTYGYNYATSMGENLAAGYTDAARTFVQWKNSPSHNSAMLNGAFKVIGISRVYGQFSQYKWYWTTNFGGFVDATFGGSGTTPTPTPAPAAQTVRIVNAGNYSQNVAPEAIATIFGSAMTGSTASATTMPLPNSLAGLTVTVNEQRAQMFYASGAQVNFVVPGSVAAGTATVKVFNNGVLIGNGAVAVAHVSPSVFTVSANGAGTAAAQTTSNGVSYQSTVNADGSARAISVGTSASPNYLVLYGTGMRGRSSLSGVRVTIGGISAPVTYLGAHGQFPGLDQLNVKLPLELRGRGQVDVVVTIDNRASNTARLNIGN